MGSYDDTAVAHADRAAYATGSEAQNEAIGNGLAAIAYALLELADKVDDVRHELTSLREERRR